MGLLSLTPLLTGAAKEVYTWQEQAQQKEDIYNENFAKAVNNVNTITRELGNQYDDAVRLSNLVGGGSFANYLMDAESLDRLSSIYNLSGDDRDEELLNLKKKFDAIDKSKYEDLDFTQTAKQKLEKETQAVRTEQIGAVGKPPTPTSKFEGFITQGVRRGGEQIREDIMTGITPPQPTAEYRPQEGGLEALGATVSNIYTLPKKSQYENIIFDDLYNYNATTQITTPKPEKQNIIDNTQAIVNDIANRGFGQYDVVQYLAEQNFANDNPDYKPVWQNYQGEFTPNSNYALGFVNQFEESLTAGTEEDLQTAKEVIELFAGSELAGNQELAKKLQVQYDNYLKDMTDESQVEEQDTVTTDIPEVKEDKKGQMTTFTPADYLSPEEKLKNSQVSVEEVAKLIPLVMEKNNVSRKQAIRILKQYGYKNFPITGTTRVRK